jgi:putative flavoprotein involved in K+ transport
MPNGRAGVRRVQHCRVPAFANQVPPSTMCLTAQQYRNPDQLPDGGVLVAGASASGTQIACEIQRSGRPVTLAWASISALRASIAAGTSSGGWTRPACSTSAMTRSTTLRGRARCRHCSSPVPPTARRSILMRSVILGVTLVGRFAGLADGKAQFAGSLRNMCAMSDLKMARLLDTIDAWARDHDWTVRSSRTSPAANAGAG